MRRLLAISLLLLFLSSLVYSEQRYIITETQLNSLEATIRKDAEIMKKQQKQLEKLERNNELLSRIVIGETCIIITIPSICLIGYLWQKNK